MEYNETAALKRLRSALQQNKQLRVMGVDDAPFDKHQDNSVNISGVECRRLCGWHI